MLVPIIDLSAPYHYRLMIVQLFILPRVVDRIQSCECGADMQILGLEAFLLGERHEKHCAHLSFSFDLFSQFHYLVKMRIRVIDVKEHKRV